MYVHTVVFSPRPGVVSLGNISGLFTSPDGGRIWPQQKVVRVSMMITMIAVNPTNPDLLAVLSVPNGSSSGKLGIWASTDGGTDSHFTLLDSFPAFAYPCIIENALGAGGHFSTSAGWFATRDLGTPGPCLPAVRLPCYRSPNS